MSTLYICDHEYTSSNRHWTVSRVVGSTSDAAHDRLYLHPCTDFQPQERLLGSTYFNYTMSKKKEGINKVIIYIN